MNKSRDAPGIDAQKLREYVGAAYQKQDSAGNALGCLLPIYLLYPEAPRVPFPKGRNWQAQALAELCRYAQAVPLDARQPGDILAFVMPFGVLHFGVYLGKDEFAHCQQERCLEIVRLNLYECRRLKGVFRLWER